MADDVTLQNAFDGPAFTCRRVVEERRPVCFVVHHRNGDWQFLCGGDEHDAAGEIRMIHAEHLAEADATLRELVDLPHGYQVERKELGAPWMRERVQSHGDAAEHPADCACCRAHHEPVDAGGFDPAERKCIDDVRRYGLHILRVSPSESDDGFAYTVGLFERYAHPEIIVFGQKPEWQHGMLNELGAQIAAGRSFVEGGSYDDLLPGFTCTFRRLRAPETYADYLGWNVWYYSDVFKPEEPFYALQFVWPDLAGHFPGTPEYRGYLQPLLR